MYKKIRSSIGKYLAIAMINVQNSLSYAGEAVYRSILIVVILYVFVNLWRAAFTQMGREVISGLSLKDTLWYLVMTETLILSKLSFASRMSDEVKEGSIAYTMGRPYNYLLYHFAYGIGDTLIRMIINFTAGSMLVTICTGGGPPLLNPFHITLLITTILLALLIDFCIEGLIGLTAFITEDVSSIQLIYGKVLFILGGMLIPIDFFPPWLQAISLRLPFNYIIYAPARLFVHFDMSRFVYTVQMQLFWILILGALLWGLFRRGQQFVAINGG